MNLQISPYHFCIPLSLLLQRLERKEKIEQIVREREMQKLEMLQRRWSKKEENDFCKTISTFGVQRYKLSLLFSFLFFFHKSLMA